jgi:hypothetical protein
MPQATSKDRRQSVRTKANRPVTLIVDSDRSRIENKAFAVDFSDLGIRIRSNVKLQPGQLVMIIPNEGPGKAVPSRVIWIEHKTPDRTSEAGLAFLQPVAVGG